MVCLQEYTVEVKLLDMCWDLRRRFSDFRKLHSSLEGCLDEKGAWPRTAPAAASRWWRARGPCAPRQPPVTVRVSVAVPCRPDRREDRVACSPGPQIVRQHGA